MHVTELPEKTKFIVTVDGDIDLRASSAQLSNQLKGMDSKGQFAWEGKWDTAQGILILTRTDDRVIGRLENGQGRLDGIIVDNQLVGQWSGGLFSSIDQTGKFRFKMPTDGNHFKIQWYSEIANNWLSDITAKRIIE